MRSLIICHYICYLWIIGTFTVLLAQCLVYVCINYISNKNANSSFYENQQARTTSVCTQPRRRGAQASNV